MGKESGLIVMLQLPDNFREQIADRVRKHEAVFERESARFAERLRRQGREAVAAYLADPSKSDDLTPADREALARYLVEYGPVDNLRDVGARRLRDIFLHIQAISEMLPAPAPSWRRRISAFAPWAIVIGAIVTGFYKPLRDLSYSVCRFVGPGKFGSYVEYDFVRLVYEPALPPIAITVIAIGFAIFGGWKSFAINLAIAAAIFFGAQGFLFISAKQEAHVPAYCVAIDPKTNSPIPQTLEQQLRIRPAYPR